VTSFKREKVMLNILGSPDRTGNRMAGFTISGITSSYMVRCSSTIILGRMARKTSRIYRLEIQVTIALVAALAINALMHTDKREPAKLVNLIYIFYNPGVC
jgi:hypothetical protein